MNLRKVLIRPELGASIAAMAIFALFASVAGQQGFLSTQGTINYLEISAQLGILATAVSLLMIAGEFDLSVGSMTGAAGRASSLDGGGIVVVGGCKETFECGTISLYPGEQPCIPHIDASGGRFMAYRAGDRKRTADLIETSHKPVVPAERTPDARILPRP